MLPLSAVRTSSVAEDRLRRVESARISAATAALREDASTGPVRDQWVETAAPLELLNASSASAPDLDQSLLELSDASLRVDDALGAALEEQLARWASAPPGERALFARWLRGAESIGGGVELGRCAGPRAGAVRAALVNVLGPLDDPEAQADLRRAFDAGVAQVLEAIEGSMSARDSEISADFLSALGPAEQVRALTDILSHWDDETAAGLGRFGEVSPEGMLYRLFEHLAEPDRRRLARSLVERGILAEPTAERLCEGRSLAGRHLPWVTGHASVAVEHWAKMSDRDDPLTRAGGTALGVAAATMLPETATATLLTLASGGISTGLVALAPTPVRAFAAGASVGATTHFAAGDLAEAITGRSRHTGAPLRPEERLSRILAGASGVLLLGSGVAIAFRSGLLTRLGPGELLRLNEGCVRLRIEGLDPKVELWVPKDSPLAREAAVSALPRGPLASLGEPSFAEAARQTARSVSGSALTGGSKSLELTVVEASDLRTRVLPLVEAGAHDAYRLAMLAGKTSTQAKNAATRAAQRTAKSLLDVTARQLVIARAEGAIDAGTCFDTAELDGLAKAQLYAYRQGKVGRTARALAPRLDGSSESRFLEVMAEEVGVGRATVRQRPNGLTWEFADGTVVRYKPEGDKYRAGPTYSVEVKKDVMTADSDLEGIAFKVDPKGRPVPKDARDLERPFSPQSTQDQAWADHLMAAGHRSLRR